MTRYWILLQTCCRYSQEVSSEQERLQEAEEAGEDYERWKKAEGQQEKIMTKKENRKWQKQEKAKLEATMLLFSIELHQSPLFALSPAT